MRRFTIAGALLLFASAGVRAEDGPYVSPTMEKVSLTLGAMMIGAKSDLRVDGSGVLGTPFDAENDFGVDRNKLGPAFDATVRVEERHRMRVDYFILDRNGSQVLTRPITFDGATLFQGDDVHSTVNLQILTFSYAYSIIHSPKFELAAGVGANVIDFTAQAQVQNALHTVNANENQAGIFPTVGLDSTWVISKRFYVSGRAQYLRVNLSEYDGSLGLYEFDALYRWRANVSAGIGYNQIRANLTPKSSSAAGYVDFHTHAPQLMVRIGF